MQIRIWSDTQVLLVHSTQHFRTKAVQKCSPAFCPRSREAASITQLIGAKQASSIQTMGHHAALVAS